MKVLTRGTVTIDVEQCKGCDMCIPACPPGVLSMSHEVNGRGYRYPVLHPGCTGCQACQQICPDWVFEVFRYEQPIKLEVADPMTAADGRDADDATGAVIA